MSATIIPFITDEDTDEAWTTFAAHSAQLVSNPHLLLDRDFMEKHARLHDRFQRLYLAGERRR